MKLTTTLLPLLSLLPPSTLAVPKTRYSTLTIIPLPLSSTIIQYHPTGSFYPTGSIRPSLYNNAYHNVSANNISLSYTLSYPTTGSLPMSTFTASSSLVPERMMQCTTSDVRCNNSTSFSLCVPDTAGGSSKVVFMGAVANGTVCEGGRIGKAPGGNCSPVGNLKCQGGRGFFLCDEGGLVYMGSATGETTCVDGEIVISGI